MIFEIKSEWEELDGKWIRAMTKNQAREYLESLDCEWGFSLDEVEGVPLSDVDFVVE